MPPSPQTRLGLDPCNPALHRRIVGKREHLATFRAMGTGIERDIGEREILSGEPVAAY